MQVFIVRPFGVKQVIRKVGGGEVQELVSFDFDKVQAELIDPALRALKLDGGTTGRIFSAGEIREDMFSELLLADIVIADISIHNANVFYELGIRNALRDRTTILLKCPGYDDTPFDIIGYRYVSYDRDEPGKAIEALKLALAESRTFEKRDSPVFNMLPKLEVQDLEKFYVIPPDFSEEVRLAAAAGDAGKLVLLGAEAVYFGLEVPALKLAGEALFGVKTHESGRAVWEKVREEKPGDYRAAERLATIYQRLADREMNQNPAEGRKLLARSDQAIEFLLATDNVLSKEQRAEAYALWARNGKTRWVSAWMACPEEERMAVALQSDFWEESLKGYELGFHTDLNHYYSGINALGLLTTILSLAEALPEIWLDRYAEDEEAEELLARLKRRHEKLAAAVKFSLEAERSLLQPGTGNLWLEITNADYLCLTNSDADKVSAAYRRVWQKCDQLQANAIVKQLFLYRALNVWKANVEAALRVTGAQPDFADDPYCLLFTGHMIDAPDRKEPRFPPGREAAVKEAIRQKVGEVVQRLPGRRMIGIAGGACGGDILFHEVCAEMGIGTELYLALPRTQFLAESVAFAGNDWIERFDALFGKLPHHIMAEAKALPRWLERKAGYNFWERNNLWMLQNALVGGGLNVTLVALWNGQSGDGPGGTRHLVAETRKQGGKTEVIDINLIA
jgi:hypothetical protein